MKQFRIKAIDSSEVTLYNEQHSFTSMQEAQTFQHGVIAGLQAAKQNPVKNSVTEI